jgi:hypothetical protein
MDYQTVVARPGTKKLVKPKVKHTPEISQEYVDFIENGDYAPESQWVYRLLTPFK